MNVDQIYRFQRDEAFAKQFTAPQLYDVCGDAVSGEPTDTTPMIFISASKRRFTYAPMTWDKICQARFAPLERASEHKGTALVVTDLITTRILEDHFFVGDLTGNNVGGDPRNGYCPCSQTESPARANHARPATMLYTST